MMGGTIESQQIGLKRKELPFMFFFFDDENHSTGYTVSDNEETVYTESLFESIRHVNEYGQEFWYARELQVALEYKQWRRFYNVIEKAKEACANSGNNPDDPFSPAWQNTKSRAHNN